MVDGQLAHLAAICGGEVLDVSGEAGSAADVNLTRMANDDDLAAVMDAGQHLLEFLHREVLSLIKDDHLVLQIHTSEEGVG